MKKLQNYFQNARVSIIFIDINQLIKKLHKKLNKL